MRVPTFTLTAVSAAALVLPPAAQAQDHSGHAMPMPAPTPAPEAAPMDRSRMDHSRMGPAKMDHAALGHATMNHSAMGHAGEGSGTARLPMNETMSHGAMIGLGGDINLMLHGYVWPIYTSQTGPRGDDKFYAQSMAMATITAPFEGGKFTARTMMSLEPAMRHDGYPNLFATGEVAYGEPLVDRQHPHDLFMELSGRLDLDIAEGTSVFLYGAPVGEPALGPSAFMHRASARYNPEAPITHHWFDSTHIVYGVATAGVSARNFQIEASAFRGREPDEFRWNIETPRLDSWSVRASFAPSPDWLAQVSYGQLHEPEELHANEDEHRTTASIHYNGGEGVSAMLGFSNKQRVADHGALGSHGGDALTAWLGEVNWDIDNHHTLFARVENVANDELFPDETSPLHEATFRVTKFQAGYAYRLPVGPLNLALGGTVAAFAKPSALAPYYGTSPMGYTLFARFSLGD